MSRKKEYACPFQDLLEDENETSFLAETVLKAKCRPGNDYRISTVGKSGFITTFYEAGEWLKKSFEVLGKAKSLKRQRTEVASVDKVVDQHLEQMQEFTRTKNICVGRKR